MRHVTCRHHIMHAGYVTRVRAEPQPNFRLRPTLPRSGQAGLHSQTAWRLPTQISDWRAREATQQPDIRDNLEPTILLACQSLTG